MIDSSDIVVAGDVMVELACAMNDFPGLDGTLVVRSDTGTLGGGALNLCWYLRQLGVRSRLHSFVGVDRRRELSLFLAELELDGSAVRPVEAATNLLLMFSDPPATRSLYFPTPLEPALVVDHLPNLSGTTTLLYAGCRDPALQLALLETVEASAATLVFLPSYALGAMAADVVRRFIRKAALSIVNRTEARQLREVLGTDDLARVAAALGSVLIETRDRDGAVIYSRTDTIRVAPAEIVDEGVVGAGDGFAAGMVYALGRGADLKAAGLFAARVADQIIEQRRIRSFIDPSRLPRIR